MVANLADAQTHEISPDTLLDHDATIRQAKRRAEDANALLSGARKAAKNASVDLKAYKFVEQLRRLDEDEQRVVVRHVVQYCQWLEMPVGTQFSLIDAPLMPAPKAKSRSAHDRFVASEAGLRAGRDGDRADNNPHQPGTELHAVWATAWQDGLAERATAAAMQEADANAAPVKQRRRSGNDRDAKRADLRLNTAVH